MDQELIIQALKSACGNKNLRFQVIVQASKLHIYINHKTEQHPEYDYLTDIAIKAIAPLPLDDFAGVWLYNRKLGEVEPSWQQYIKLPIKVNSDDLDTIANSEEIESELDTDSFAEQVSTGNTGLLDNTGMVHKAPLQEAEISTFDYLKEADDQQDEYDPENPFIFETETAEDSAGNTGLLDNTGMVHKAPLQEAEINTFANKLISTDNSESHSQDESNLAQYCFVTNDKLLTSDILPPDKEIIRLVKVFHHLSDNNKEKILPILDDYFKLAKVPDTENLAVGVQKWFKQIVELEEDDRRTIEIWLSRYCFDTNATIMEFKAIAEKNAALEVDRSNKRNNTEYSFTPANTESESADAQANFADDFQEFSQPRFKFNFKLPPIIDQNILPLTWTTATVILIILGIFTSSAKTTTDAIPALCSNTVGSPNHCRLAVNLAGANTIKKSPPSIFPLTDITKAAATIGCERYANVKAGITGNIDPRQTPVISSTGSQVLANIFVVEAQQKNVSQPGNTKVGCVYTAGQGERSPELLAADVIPQSWPLLHYQPKSKSQSDVSFGIYSNLINLGLYAIFYALGIAIASKFNLGIKVSRNQTIYLVAVILALVQLVAGKLPVFNLLASTVLPVLGILALSIIIKDFQLHRDRGYSLVAAGVLTIVAVRFLLYGLFLSLVGGLV